MVYYMNIQNSFKKFGKLGDKLAGATGQKIVKVFLGFSEPKQGGY